MPVLSSNISKFILKLRSFTTAYLVEAQAAVDSTRIGRLVGIFPPEIEDGTINVVDYLFYSSLNQYYFAPMN